MSDLVGTDKIEQIVGAPRHRDKHFARAVSAEQRVYVLHPDACIAAHPDPRDCDYSRALDRGIDMKVWSRWEDMPAFVLIHHRRLVPVEAPRLPSCAGRSIPCEP